jgi:uncharacterized protein YbjQ (UPF0145 family)
MPSMTGLSGNEIYCLRLKQLLPGDLVVGNSVQSLGFARAIGAGLSTLFGGEVTEISAAIGEGRFASYKRMTHEAQQHGALAISGVTSDLRTLQGNIEFLSVGSCVHRGEDAPPLDPFSASIDGQALYCLLDAGYSPKHFVFGNVAYSVGLAGGILGTLRSFARGEIKEFSDIFNATRHLALQRISAGATAVGANAVIGIETRITPFRGVHEMLMLGTAAHHPALPFTNEPVTSDLTCEEMWNLAALGFMPLKLVLATSVYSLGLIGGLKAFLRGFARGEVGELSSLFYDARAHAIDILKREADAIGADDVVGIKTRIQEHGSLIEFMAMGTAVRRVAGAAPLSPVLPVQAVIKDRDTWISNQSIFASDVRSGRGDD